MPSSTLRNREERQGKKNQRLSVIFEYINVNVMQMKHGNVNETPYKDKVSKHPAMMTHNCGMLYVHNNQSQKHSYKHNYRLISESVLYFTITTHETNISSHTH